jgi:hypothetical protein
MRATIARHHFSNLATWLGNAIKGRRKYFVSAQISFKVRCPMQASDLAKLREAIFKFSRTFPWFGDEFADKRSDVRVRHTDETRIASQSPLIDETYVSYDITHNDGRWMRRDQVYAYEKYLAKLAAALATMHLPNVREVRSTVKTEASTSFEAA